MSRIDVLDEIEAVRVDGYVEPTMPFARQWERFMFTLNGNGYMISLSATKRSNGAIVSGGGMEIKCGVLDVQAAADAVGAWCRKLSQRG